MKEEETEEERKGKEKDRSILTHHGSFTHCLLHAITFTVTAPHRIRTKEINEI